MSVQTQPTTGYVDKDEAVAVLEQTSAALVRAIRGIRNPDVPAVGTWTVRDVAAHLGDAFEVHQKVVRGDNAPIDTMDQIAEVNQRMIDANPERDVDVLADRVESATNVYVEHLRSIPGDAIVAWADLEIPITTVISADIGECLVHGYDIAHTEGRPWPIDPYHAAVAVKGVSPMTVHYVDPRAARDLTATFDLRLRGQLRLDFVFEDGELRIEEPSGRPADVHISADPATFLLVGYGRMSLWGPMAKGRLLAWGRKPWLALRFGSLLKKP
jgi:uncharacterized protein (TIGR03083 family)